MLYTLNIFNSIKNNVDNELLKFILILTLSVGFITYGFGYYNLGFSHDSLHIYLKGLGLGQLSIGRPFTSFIYDFFENYNNKFIMGGASLLFISFSVYTTVKIFSILLCFDKRQQKLLSVVISLLYLFNIAFISLNATYSFQICCDTLALLTATIAVYVVFNKQDYKKICLSIIFCTISIGLYQAYINVFLALFICVLIIKLYLGDYYSTVLRTGIIYFLIVLTASILYFVIWKYLMLKHNLTATNSYNSPSNIGYTSFEDLVNWIFVSVKNTSDTLFKTNSFNIKHMRLFNIMCLIIIIVGAVKVLITSRGIFNKLLLILLFSLFILSLNITNIVSKDVFHNLMAFAVCLVNGVAFVILLKNGKKIIINMFLIWLAVISFHCCNFYNTVSMMKVMELEATYSHFSRILQRIESIPDFNRNIDIILMEPLERSEYFNQNTNSIFFKKKHITGCAQNVAATYDPQLFADFYGLGLKIYPINDSDSIKSLDLTNDQIVLINSLSPYPALDSVKRVGKYIVVKNSNTLYTLN